MIQELKTNASGHIGRRNPARAAALAEIDPATLFHPVALDAYLRPVASNSSTPAEEWPGFGSGEPSRRRGKARNGGRGDLEGMAKACEKYFEWGTKEIVEKKFASENVGVFGSEILNDARDWVRTGLGGATPGASSTGVRKGPAGQITSFFSSVQPAPTLVQAKAHLHTETQAPTQSYPPYLVKVHSKRPDPTNISITEYRVSYRVNDFAARCKNAMEGCRVDPKLLSVTDRAALGLVDKPDDVDLAPTACGSKSDVRLWMPDYLLNEAWPDVVQIYEDGVQAKEEARLAKEQRKAFPESRRRFTKTVSAPENATAFRTFFSRGTASAIPLEPTVELPSMPASSPIRRSVSTVDLTASPDAPSVHATAALSETSKRTRQSSDSSRSSSSQAVNSATTTSRSISKPPPRRSARLSLDGKIKGAQNTPIDLCSSDEEVPKIIRMPHKPSKYSKTYQYSAVPDDGCCHCREASQGSRSRYTKK